MKKNEKMQSNNKVNNKQQNKMTNRNNNKISNKQSCNVTDSHKNVGFVSDSDSFELDSDEDHSFELRDCK